MVTSLDETTVYMAKDRESTRDDRQTETDYASKELPRNFNPRKTLQTPNLHRAHNNACIHAVTPFHTILQHLCTTLPIAKSK